MEVVARITKALAIKIILLFHVCYIIRCILAAICYVIKTEYKGEITYEKRSHDLEIKEAIRQQQNNWNLSDALGFPGKRVDDGYRESGSLTPGATNEHHSTHNKG